MKRTPEDASAEGGQLFRELELFLKDPRNIRMSGLNASQIRCLKGLKADLEAGQIPSGDKIHLFHEAIARLESARKSSIKRFCRRGVLASLVGGAAVALTEPWKLLETEGDAFEKLIQAFEQAFEKLLKKVEDLIPKTMDDQTRKNFIAPFQYVIENVKYPDRNLVAVREQQKPLIEYIFAYDQLHEGLLDRNLPKNRPGTLSVRAAVHGSTRTMLLPKDFDPSSMIDLITAYHELMHLEQELYDASPEGKTKNLAFHKALETLDLRKGVVLEVEVYAHCYELELINVLLSDALARGEKLRIEEISDRLEGAGRPPRSGYYNFSYPLLLAYFPHRDEKALTEALKKQYLQGGSIVWTWTGTEFKKL